MAFRATNIIPFRAYQQVKGAASQLKINCVDFIASTLASGATYSFLRDVYLTLYNANNQFTQLASTPGLAAYAQSQENDVNYDIAAEFTSMQSTLTAAINWLNANVPTNVVAVSPVNWPSSSNMISTTFTSGQTAPLRTLLQAIVDAIE